MGAVLFDYKPEGFPGARWSTMVVLSMLLHAGVISGVVFYPGSAPSRKITGPVYEVNLVELPSSRSVEMVQPKGATAETAPAPAKARAVVDPAPAKRIEPARPAEKPVVIAKRVVEAPTPAVPRPKVDPAKLMDRAPDRDEKKPETGKADPSALISDAVTRIQKEVEEKKREESLIGDAIARLETRQEEAGKGEEGRGEAPGMSIRGRLYEMQVMDRIMRNWTYPATLDSVSGDPRAVVVLQVGSNGSIISYSIRRKSANPRFDESVLKAVERSDPLPPFPQGFAKQEEIVLNFNLSDLRR